MPKPKRPAAASPSTASRTRIEQRDRLLLQAVLAWRAGRHDDAERIGAQVLAIAPRHAPALQLLGIIAARTGRDALAIARLTDAVSIDPDNVDARNELATVLRANGEHSRAIEHCRQVLNRQPNDVAALNNMGLAQFELRDLAGAVGAFERAVASNPAVAGPHLNLGIVLQTQGRNGEAESAYRAAIARAPHLSDAHGRLAHLLRLAGKNAEADERFKRALSLALDTTARLSLARLLYEAGELDTAERCLRDALARDPRCAIAHEDLGRLLQQRGRFDEAVASFASAVDCDSRHTGAYVGIVTSRRMNAADRPLLDRIVGRLDHAELGDSDRANLHYALGKAYDDLGRYDVAMREFDAANGIAAQSLRRSGRMLDRARHGAIVDRLIATYTRPFFARHAGLGDPDETPILIVGMIRSGTSLVEQILSSHRDVGAAGELRFWGDRAHAATDAAAGRLDAATATRIRSDYLQLLHGIAPAAKRVTDKMPTNFMMLGLVHLLLPRARIVHCRRHPVDTCLSIYTTPFSRSPDYAHDRGNLVFYYRQYVRLMAHWRAVLPPDRFLDLDYERLTSDREDITRQLIAFCGLDWDDACLHHESNVRPIRTPSVWQARQPIYRTSVERWRRYEASLREFAGLLDTPSADMQ